MENDLAEIVIDTELKPTLLVVDDSRVMCVSLKKILKTDFEVIEAVDGEDAWDKLLASPEVQGIFSDLSMPHLDGYGLLERVRNSDEARIRDLPFIVITGKEGDLSDLLAEVQGKGANDLVGKPFKTDDIISRTKQFLQQGAGPVEDDEDVVHLNPEVEARQQAEVEAQRQVAEAARLAAEAEAQRQAEEARLAAEAEAQRQAEEAARLAAEAEAQRQAEEAARLAAEAEAQRQAEEVASLAAEAEAQRQAEEAARLAAEAEARRQAEEEAQRQAAKVAAAAQHEQTLAEQQAENHRLELEEVERQEELEERGAQLSGEEQVSVEAIRARLRAEIAEQEYIDIPEYGGMQAVLVRIALPFMSLFNSLLKLKLDDRIQSMKDRLPK